MSHSSHYEPMRDRGPYGPKSKAPVDPPGAGGDNGGMEGRISALEARLDATVPSLATKADVIEVEGKVIRWVAGIGIATVTVLVSVMGFFFSRLDTKPALPSTQTAPVIIQIPPMPTSPSPSNAPPPASAAPQAPEATKPPASVPK